MGGDEFGIGAEHFLHRLDYAAFYARDVGHDNARSECVLIFAHPVEQNVRIEREDYQVRPSYRIGVGLGIAAVDVVVCEREFNSLRAAVYRLDVISPAVQRHCVAAADESESYYKNPCFLG